VCILHFLCFLCFLHILRLLWYNAGNHQGMKPLMIKALEGTRMISYARMYGWKNPDAIRTAFVSCGADPDEIIIDDSHGRKKESEAYLKAKESAVISRELIIDSLDSIGKTNREIAKELEWLSSNIINLLVMDLQATMEPGIQSTGILRDVYARLAEEERERVRKAQVAGIRKAQTDQKKLGRTRIPIPANWNENYSKWEKGEITIDQFMKETGLKRGTLYNLIKAAKGEKKQQETCG